MWQKEGFYFSHQDILQIHLHLDKWTLMVVATGTANNTAHSYTITLNWNRYLYGRCACSKFVPHGSNLNVVVFLRVNG